MGANGVRRHFGGYNRAVVKLMRRAVAVFALLLLTLAPAAPAESPGLRYELRGAAGPLSSRELSLGRQGTPRFGHNRDPEEVDTPRPAEAREDEDTHQRPTNAMECGAWAPCLALAEPAGRCARSAPRRRPQSGVEPPHSKVWSAVPGHRCLALAEPAGRCARSAPRRRPQSGVEPPHSKVWSAVPGHRCLGLAGPAGRCARSAPRRRPQSIGRPTGGPAGRQGPIDCQLARACVHWPHERGGTFRAL